MPRLEAPLGYCTTPGCSARAHGRCPLHQRQRKQRAEQTRVRSDARLHTQRWRKYAKQFLAARPWCAGYPVGVHIGTLVLAECVDHVQSTKARPDLFWEPSNHASLCMDCNRRKGIAEEGGFGRANMCDL